MATSIPSRGAKTVDMAEMKKMEMKKKIKGKKDSMLADLLSGRALVEGARVVGKAALGTVGNMMSSVSQTEKQRRKINGQN